MSGFGFHTVGGMIFNRLAMIVLLTVSGVGVFLMPAQSSMLLMMATMFWLPLLVCSMSFEAHAKGFPLRRYGSPHLFLLAVCASVAIIVKTVMSVDALTANRMLVVMLIVWQIVGIMLDIIAWRHR